MSVSLVLVITGVLCLLLAAISGIRSMVVGDPAGGPVVSAVAALAMVFTGPHLLQRLVENTPQETVVIQSDPMAAMSNATRLEGSVGTFGGYISEDDTYSYVRTHEDGTHSLENIEAQDVRIREDATPETARLEVTQCHRTDDNAIMLVGKECSSPTTTLHVPPESIDRDFSIDTNRQ